MRASALGKKAIAGHSQADSAFWLQQLSGRAVNFLQCKGLLFVRYNEVFMLLSCCHLAYPYYQTHYLQKMLKDLMRLELWWSLSRPLLGVEDVTYERHSNYHYLFLQIRTVCGASDADKIALFLPWGLGLVTF
ncbi:hypothetical protein QUB63_17910 [Microcoleus sp. ARI1-B5]|uniref:hypothetical protein n=1 Tax=unclassified Microcoleus TaxID=2642155 RepID=UPI002FD6153E